MITALSQAALDIPADAVRMTSIFLHSMSGVEACCFWYGERPATGHAKVAAIIIPRQKNRPGNYHVEADEMLRVADVARPKGWKNLAQIHSHPGQDVRHSSYDDEMANSRRALSLIFPAYGSVRGMWRFRGWLHCVWPCAVPPAIGVHAFLNGTWTLLRQADVADAANVTSDPPPAVIDLR